jgi:WD40 repeat protein
MRPFLLLLALLLAVSMATAQPTVIRSFPSSGFGSVFPGGLGYDYVTDHLWVADETNKKGYEITRTGAAVSTIDLQSLGITQPIGAGVDSKGKVFFVAEEINKKIWQIDTVSRAVITMTNVSAVSDPSGLDYNPIRHSVITSDDSAGLIHEWDLMTMQPVSTLNVKSVSGDADGLGCNTFNGMYLIGDDSAGKIIEMADDGFVMNSWSATQYAMNRPEAVTMDPQTGNYFVASGVNDMIYEVSGGVTLTPALTADKITINKSEKVTFTLRTDPARWPYAGIVLIGLGGGSIPFPVILAQAPVNNLGKVTFSFVNPGLGGILVTLVGGGFSVVSPYPFQLSNVLNVTMN